MIATLPRNHAPFNPGPLVKNTGPPPVVSHRPPRGPGRAPVRSASVNTHTHGTKIVTYYDKVQVPVRWCLTILVII